MNALTITIVRSKIVTFNFAALINKQNPQIIFYITRDDV